jgi:hypothetical protein
MRRKRAETPEAPESPETAETAETAETGTTVQLTLISGDRGRGVRPDWVLDARTRRLGRMGVAAAREALRQATPPGHASTGNAA